MRDFLGIVVAGDLVTDEGIEIPVVVPIKPGCSLVVTMPDLVQQSDYCFWR